MAIQTTPQVGATVSFIQRSGTKVGGIYRDTIGVCWLIEVTVTNRKNLRNKTTLFPINDMGGLKVEDISRCVRYDA